MASSTHHARQLVAHGHIALDQAKVTTPSRLISVNEEDRISYTGRSPMNDASHPARIAASAAAQRIAAGPEDESFEEADREGGRRRPDSGQFRDAKPGPKADSG